MGIILKNALSNVLANKRRSLLMLLCMVVVAFSAMTAFSMSDMISVVLDDYVSQMYGDAMVTVDNDNVNTEQLELPDYARPMYFYKTSIHTQKHSAVNFAYATKSTYDLIGVDIKQAQDERYFLYDEPLELGENEIIISEMLAKEEGWDVGSTIDIMTKNDEELTLKVKYILKNERYLKELGAVAVAETSLIEKIDCRPGYWSSCNVFFTDDTSADVFIEEMQEQYSSMTFLNLRLNDNAMASIKLMFIAIFLILTLIIFIVTSGISEHIIRERMSQMGTLRSIGATRLMTSAALISENLYYSIPGAIIGIIIFIPFGSFFIKDLFSTSGIDIGDFRAKVSYIILVFFLTIFVSCLSSVKAVLKAIKTPIRDIIFGGRDSAYQLKKGKAYAGLAMLAVGAVCGLTINNAIVILLSLVLVTAGSIFFIPMLLRIICKFFKKSENPIISFSFNNIATKKTVISSAVLFSVVIALVSAVFMETSYINNDVSSYAFSGDIILNMLSDKPDNYRFISALDEVEKSELVYFSFKNYKINDMKPVNNCYIIGYDPDSTLFKGVKGIDGALAMDEISIDTRLMNAYKIKEGDVLNITFNLDGERPVELTLRAVKGCDTSGIDFDRSSSVINVELFKKYFFDSPEALLVKLKDPEKTDDVISVIKTYLMDKQAWVNTYDEYIQLQQAGEGGIQSLLYIIIGTGCLLSLIMLSTNLTIGFEQRKKELAVLHSTSMSRSQLSRMLFCETAFSLAVSTIWAILSGGACYVLIVRFVAVINEVPPSLPDNLHLAFIIPVIMLAAALIVASFSRNKVAKMNTANEMKYE